MEMSFLLYLQLLLSSKPLLSSLDGGSSDLPPALLQTLFSVAPAAPSLWPISPSPSPDQACVVHHPSFVLLHGSEILLLHDEPHQIFASQRFSSSPLHATNLLLCVSLLIPISFLLPS